MSCGSWKIFFFKQWYFMVRLEAPQAVERSLLACCRGAHCFAVSWRLLLQSCQAPRHLSFKKGKKETNSALAFLSLDDCERGWQLHVLWGIMQNISKTAAFSPSSVYLPRESAKDWSGEKRNGVGKTALESIESKWLGASLLNTSYLFGI